MALTGTTSATPPLDRRSTRRTLTAERAQLTRWRRLLRARLDLTVAGFAPPEPLGTMTGEVLPGAVQQLPPAVDLSAAVACVTPIDPVELMTRLRHLDRTLEAYGHEIDAALETSTDGVVRKLARRHPAAPPPHPEAVRSDGR